MADSDSILAIQSKNWTHIHRLRNLIHQTSKSLLLALEAVGWGGGGCDSVVELWLPCTESFLPQRERERGRVGLRDSILIQVKQGERIRDQV